MLVQPCTGGLPESSSLERSPRHGEQRANNCFALGAEFSSTPRELWHVKFAVPGLGTRNKAWGGGTWVQKYMLQDFGGFACANRGQRHSRASDKSMYMISWTWQSDGSSQRESLGMVAFHNWCIRSQSPAQSLPSISLSSPFVFSHLRGVIVCRQNC